LNRDHREYFIYTIQKDLILKEEKTGWTKDPEVVDRMDHRYFLPSRSYEYGRGGGKEPIVYMNDIRPEPADSPDDPYKRVRVEKEEQEFHRGEFFIIKKDGMDGATSLFHQLHFILVHDIFSAALYIVGMDVKYAHDQRIVDARSLFST
jgi:hypothetical protein